MNPAIKAHLISAALTVVASFLSILAIQISHLDPTTVDLAGVMVIIRAALKLTIENSLRSAVALSV